MVPHALRGTGIARWSLWQWQLGYTSVHHPSDPQLLIRSYAFSDGVADPESFVHSMGFTSRMSIPVAAHGWPETGLDCEAHPLEGGHGEFYRDLSFDIHLTQDQISNYIRQFLIAAITSGKCVLGKPARKPIIPLFPVRYTLSLQLTAGKQAWSRT